MEYDLQFKIFSDQKLDQYLKNNSHWYKYLNRSSDYYEAFLAEYKKHNRENQTKKITSAIGTLDTVNTIFNIIK